MSTSPHAWSARLLADRVGLHQRFLDLIGKVRDDQVSQRASLHARIPLRQIRDSVMQSLGCPPITLDDLRGAEHQGVIAVLHELEAVVMHLCGTGWFSTPILRHVEIVTYLGVSAPSVVDHGLWSGDVGLSVAAYAGAPASVQGAATEVETEETVVVSINAKGHIWVGSNQLKVFEREAGGTPMSARGRKHRLVAIIEDLARHERAKTTRKNMLLLNRYLLKSRIRAFALEERRGPPGRTKEVWVEARRSSGLVRLQIEER